MISQFLVCSVVFFKPGHDLLAKEVERQSPAHLEMLILLLCKDETGLLST